MHCSVTGAPYAAFKILGPVAMALLAAAVTFLLKKYPQGRAAGISKHGGAAKHTYWVFMPVMLAFALLFSLFMALWFIPALHLPLAFKIVFVLSLALQVAAAVIPERADKSLLSRVHVQVAFGMAYTMPVLIGILALSAGVSPAARIVAGLATAWMVCCFYLFVFVKSTHKHFLPYQASFIGSFFVAILAATYLR